MRAYYGIIMVGGRRHLSASYPLVTHRHSRVVVELYYLSLLSTATRRRALFTPRPLPTLNAIPTCYPTPNCYYKAGGFIVRFLRVGVKSSTFWPAFAAEVDP